MEIRLEHITKVFKNTVAVKDMNVIIPDGELVCLLGPSGCGKSTTLSMVAGLEHPSEGEIYFDGQPMSNVEAQKRDIGMVFQNYALYPHMTVSENIQFPLKMHWMKKSLRLQKTQDIARMMQITDLLHRKPSQLSGGQQQRVAIARALVKEPKILLLDEPFSNLDARLRIELRDDIRALQKKLGITTIFVTHDQEEAMSISDRILLMNKGCLQQYSTPQEMYRFPANLFVAGFLGNPPINLLPCTWTNNTIQVKGTQGWDFSGISPVIAQETGKDIIAQETGKDIIAQETGKDAILGIRPEDLVIVPERGQIQAQITAIQTLGKEVYLRLQHQDIHLTACLNWDHDYQISDHLHLNVKKAYLFPASEQTPEGGVPDEQ